MRRLYIALSLFLVGCAAPVSAATHNLYLPNVMAYVPWAGWAAQSGWQFVQVDGYDIARVHAYNPATLRLTSPTYMAAAQGVSLSAAARITDGVGNLAFQLVWDDGTSSVPMLFAGGPAWTTIEATWPIPDGVTTFQVLVTANPSTSLTADVRDVQLN